MESLLFLHQYQVCFTVSSQLQHFQWFNLLPVSYGFGTETAMRLSNSVSFVTVMVAIIYYFIDMYLKSQVSKQNVKLMVNFLDNRNDERSF